MTPLDALQVTLAGEHAAVYVYGVLGGRVSRSAEPILADRVRTAYNLHRGRRDQLVAMVRDADGEPVAAAVSYQVPTSAQTPGEIAAAALTVEQRCTAKYADMTGNTARAERLWALNALTDAAVRQLGFGGTPQTFPGLAGF